MGLPNKEVNLSRGGIPLKSVEPDQELENEDFSESGRPPRRRPALLLGLTAATGVLIGVIVFFLFSAPPEKDGQRPAPPTRQAESSDQPGRTKESPATDASSGAVGVASSSAERGSVESPPLFPPEKAPSEGPFDLRSSLPVITLPAEADRFDLESLRFPATPYCIYTGAHQDLQEAETTRSELESNYLSAYIVPVEVNGNVAQSLFGVTKDGTWYGVMTGHFGSKDEARNTLGLMMKELPGYQPEIMRFPYALECGRFLVPEEARALAEQLDQASLFPYTQTYPTNDGRSLTRVLSGCYFSEPYAQAQELILEGKGFSCQVVER